MGIDPAAYATLTSFTHHPFGTSFVLEVPDNHAHGAFYNVELDDLEEAVHHALENGYTVAWDADVSNKGFSFRDGWAIMPEAAGSKEEWETLDAMPIEPAVDQAMRQSAFDSQENTDDHLMHIVGRAADAQGREYFIIKNSWGQGNDNGGKQYVSMAYFRHHTIGIMLHEEGLTKEMRKAMGLPTEGGEQEVNKPPVRSCHWLKFCELLPPTIPPFDCTFLCNVVLHRTTCLAWLVLLV